MIVSGAIAFEEAVKFGLWVVANNLRQQRSLKKNLWKTTNKEKIKRKTYSKNIKNVQNFRTLKLD